MDKEFTWEYGARMGSGMPGRPKEEFAPLKLRNRFGRGSVSIIGRAVGRAEREESWDQGGREAAETPQTIANT
jgi:hypothetical protein